ncbi:Uncharacterised protein [Candidatus Burarchaeum australiense]|nr:Uncharacterised protein [Candidatus Burarchaeum australiense]
MMQRLDHTRIACLGSKFAPQSIMADRRGRLYLSMPQNETIIKDRLEDGGRRIPDLRIYHVTSDQPELIASVRGLWAGRIGDNDVESVEKITALLENGVAGNPYFVYAITDGEANVISAVNVIPWKEIGTLQCVLLATDERMENKGYGTLAAMAGLSGAWATLGPHDRARYVFGELEPVMKNFEIFGKMTGGNLRIADATYTLPPLEEGRQPTSLMAGLIVIDPHESDEQMHKSDYARLVNYVHENFYGTLDYAKRMLLTVPSRIQLLNPMEMAAEGLQTLMEKLTR